MATKWDARNERARDLGYRNYYDYRAHGYGRDAPTQPAARGEDLARLRGHRGPSDLAAVANRVEVLTIMPGTRNAKGQWTSALVLVEMNDGTTRQYRIPASHLKNRDRMADLYSTLVSGGGGGVVVDVYSMFGEADDIDDLGAWEEDAGA